MNKFCVEFSIINSEVRVCGSNILNKEAHEFDPLSTNSSGMALWSAGFSTTHSIIAREVHGCKVKHITQSSEPCLVSPLCLRYWRVGAKDAACLQEFEAAGADDEGVSSVSYNNPIRSNNAYHWIRTYWGWPFICILRLKLLCLNPSISSPSPSSAPSAPLPPSTSHAIDKSRLGMWGVSSPIACQSSTKGKISS